MGFQFSQQSAKLQLIRTRNIYYSMWLKRISDRCNSRLLVLYSQTSVKRDRVWLKYLPWRLATGVYTDSGTQAEEQALHAQSPTQFGVFGPWTV